MFYERLCQLCNENGITITGLVVHLGISKSNVTNWKCGKVPKSDTVKRIADYFGVSTDCLLGNTDIKEKPAADSSELLARLSDPKFRELVQILSTASDKDLDLLIELVRRIDIEKQDA